MTVCRVGGRAARGLAQDELSILAQLAELQEPAGTATAATRHAPQAARARSGRRARPSGLMRAVRDRRSPRPALRQYERLRTVLGRELGVEPSDESQQLYREILEGRSAQPPDLVRPSAPDGRPPCAHRRHASRPRPPYPAAGTTCPSS